MKKSLRTFIKHTAKDFHNQSVNPPVVRASTIIFKSLNEIEKTQKKYLKDPRSGNFDYGRQGTSTTHALQRILQEMEECYKVYLTPTGFGSIFLAVLSVIEPGDEILVTDSVYSPTRLLTQSYLIKFNIKSLFYDHKNINDLKSKITKKTKLILVENPGSNTFEFQDLRKIVSLAKKNKIYTAIDNTWGTPYLIKPMKLGFDMCIVSATKYYSGHSDVMGGSLAVNKRVFKLVEATNRVSGLRMSPDDAYLILRGIRTLDVRMDKHHINALQVSNFLSKQKKVLSVSIKSPGSIISTSFVKPTKSAKRIDDVEKYFVILFVSTTFDISSGSIFWLELSLNSCSSILTTWSASSLSPSI